MSAARDLNNGVRQLVLDESSEQSTYLCNKRYLNFKEIRCYRRKLQFSNKVI